MKRTVVLSSLLLVLAACISGGNHLAAVQPVPDSLKPAAGEALVGSVAARGVQIYQCRVKTDQSTAMEWAFVAPEADLFDAQGKVVGKHFAGPSWENLDGSKIAGSVRARADAPQANAIPWLLLATKSVGPDGAFAKVTSVQRINTQGGVAPNVADCTPEWPGRIARIAYSADYVMFGSN